MKILVYPHRLEVGGVQVNAIELTAHLRDRRGHDVLMFGVPGPMSKLVEEKGIRFIPAPDSASHPSWSRIKALLTLIRQERPDVLHVWDWPQMLDSYATQLLKRVPMVVTCMSMTVDRQLPKFAATTFGTPELVDIAKARGWMQPNLLLPPVDVDANAPNSVDTTEFVQKFNIKSDEINLVTVSRLVAWMKAESIRETIEAVRVLGRDHPLRFILVGDGTSKDALQKLADETNQELGREAVTLTGAMLDPRPAYASASIVIGMGGSGLRGMSFAKPVIVTGERGFARPFTPETRDMFMYQGIYGLGDGTDKTPVRRSIVELLTRRAELPALGTFSRDFVFKNFSLDSVAEGAERVLARAGATRPGAGLAALDVLRTATIILGRSYVIRPIRALARASR